MIVIVNGPNGIGKTTVIRRLGERMAWLAHVDQSQLSSCVLQPNHAADRYQLGREHVVSVTANCVRRGYHVLVEGVFELESDLDALCSRLSQLDPLVYRFRLRCGAASVPGAGDAGGNTAHQAAWLDRAPGDLGLLIDTSDRSVDEVADEIVEHIEQGRGLYRVPGMLRVPAGARPYRLARTA